MQSLWSLNHRSARDQNTDISGCVVESASGSGIQIHSGGKSESEKYLLTMQKVTYRPKKANKADRGQDTGKNPWTRPTRAAVDTQGSRAMW